MEIIIRIDINDVNFRIREICAEHGASVGECDEQYEEALEMLTRKKHEDAQRLERLGSLWHNCFKAVGGEMEMGMRDAFYLGFITGKSIGARIEDCTKYSVYLTTKG